MGPRHLALASAERELPLVHVSSDYVFDGCAGRPYHEFDATNPQSTYGRSKLAGEQEVLETLPETSVVLRTSWVYSRFGRNFVRTMLRLMREREDLAIVADQVGSPTWAKGLAEAIWEIVDRAELSGIFHWTDAGVASWYDFAVAIRDEALSLGILDRRLTIRPQRTADFPTPATRPPYSVLDKTATWEALELRPRHWREALRLMLSELPGDNDG